ncbi:HutD family protein [Brevibacterium album]|uniref:HutD family protein n=1 Tax=Brevibacterium album TaxID=417948 RepID=UPI0006848DD6|nr:HutD family protein [Brevibacterium album]
MSDPGASSLQTLASHAERQPVPWANGAGSTVELVSLAESASLTPGRPRWRLSIAALERPAEFSPLPGMRRVFRPVGADVVLLIDGRRHEIADGDPCAFDGGAATSLVELTGPCHAVNLMTETGFATGESSAEHSAPEAAEDSAAGPDGSFLLTLEDSDLGPRFTLLRERGVRGQEGTGQRSGPGAGAPDDDSPHDGTAESLGGIRVLRF